MEDVDMQEFFEITSVSRDDLSALGFDVSDISDEIMQDIANDMAEDYCEQLFWSSLETVAEYYNIPKQNNNG